MLTFAYMVGEWVCNKKITESIFVFEAALTSEVNLASCSLGVSTLSP